MSRRLIGLILGPTLFLTTLTLPPPASFALSAAAILAPGISPEAIGHVVFSMQVVLAVMLLMVTWWLSEAVPLPVTALIPPALLPWFGLSGIEDGMTIPLSLRSVLQGYAHPVIYLFLGGFLLAGAMRKWGLDRRITYWVLSHGRLASDTRITLLAIMFLTAFISMWISNTATAAMMLPIGMGVVSLVRDATRRTQFTTAVMLGIAWSASVGGAGTIIGSPPNGIAIAVLDTHFASEGGSAGITFLDWMKFGVPYVVLFVPIIWLLLIRRFVPGGETLEGGKERLLREMGALGRFTIGEKWTMAVFSLAVLLWVSNPFWNLLLPEPIFRRIAFVDEFLIGLGAGLLLFLLPVDFRKVRFVLEWKDTGYVDWGILILFGGGIALSHAMFGTGLASWFAHLLIGASESPSILLFILLVVLFVDFLTEITSNTAVTTMMVPIVISIASVIGADPVTLAVATALAASMAFMLPVATPPNALVFSSGEVSLRDMVRTGFVLDILGWFFTVSVLWFFGSYLFGVVRF